LRKFLFLFFLPFISCHSPEARHPSIHSDSLFVTDTFSGNCKFQYEWLDSSAYHSSDALCSRFKIPQDFFTVRNPSGSFGEWLNGLPLFPEGTPVHLYTGELKGYQGAHAAVINLDLSNEDLQQGAYAVIRLRAEYLFATKQFEKIIFPSVDSLQLDYLQYLRGRRIIIQGNKTSENYYGKKYADPANHKVFLLFMNDVFRYAEISSLSSEMKSVPADSMLVGDIFIHPGNPGHAVIIVDMAVNPKTGDRIFMLAQSYRPAQQMHVLKNDFNKNISPWYSVHSKSKLITPEYVFDWGELKRF
jgi:hypothetical protein